MSDRYLASTEDGDLLLMDRGDSIAVTFGVTPLVQYTLDLSRDQARLLHGWLGVALGQEDT